MVMTKGHAKSTFRFHPDLIPLRDRVINEGKEKGQSFNKRVINILEEYYAMKDAEEKKKTITK
jgi:hypothetical protein